MRRQVKGYFRHNLSGHPIYNTWNSMWNRCGNPKDNAYEYYGGRGITICKAWENPWLFYLWAKDNNWQKGLTIERINNDGNYEPSNCTWIPNTEQYKNRRTNKRQHWFFAFHLRTGRKIVSNNQNKFAKRHDLYASNVSFCANSKQNRTGGWRLFRLPDMRTTTH